MKLKFRCFFIFLIFIQIYCVISYGYDLELNTDNTENIVISVKIKDLETEGINVYSGKLEYDSNVFEDVTEEDFKLQNSWKKVTYNKQNGFFILESDDKVNLEEEIVKIEMKSKNDANIENTEIYITENVVSGGEDIEIENKNIEIQFNKNEEEDNKTDNIDSKYGYEIKNNYIVNVKTKTPVNEFKRILLNNLDKSANVYENNKEVSSGYIKTGMIVKIFDMNEEVEYEISVIGDVNGDGVSNLLDTNFIKSYRNDVINLEGVNFESADINRDGRINIHDTKLLLYHRAEVKGYSLDYSK